LNGTGRWDVAIIWFGKYKEKKGSQITNTHASNWNLHVLYPRYELFKDGGQTD